MLTGLARKGTPNQAVVCADLFPGTHHESRVPSRVRLLPFHDTNMTAENLLVREVHLINR